MSSTFRLKYFLGLVPSAQKIDSKWDNLITMRDKLNQLETSTEIARYNELKELIHSKTFQEKKKVIAQLSYEKSDEHAIVAEVTRIEKLKPIRDYFNFIQRFDFKTINNTEPDTVITRYKELKKIVESPEFVQRKKEVESLNYENSPEHTTRKEFEKLKNNVPLKQYYKTIDSDEYRLFMELEKAQREGGDESAKNESKTKIYQKFLHSSAYKNVQSIEKSGMVEKYNALKKQVEDKSFVEREVFLKNKNRFETTGDYESYREFTALEKTEKIKSFLNIVHSVGYKNFKEVDKSAQLAKLKELKLKIDDPEFKQRVEFLKNKRRYTTTAEYRLEEEYKELAQSTHLKHYTQLKKRAELAFFDQWEIKLDERFQNNQLSDSIWTQEHYWGAKMAGFSFSQENELQAYNGKNNIEIKNKVLSIITKKEKTTGKVWNPSIGFLPKEFDYSSGILTTGGHFSFQEGIIETKVKFKPVKAITSAFSLTGKHPFPQIDIFRSGHNSVGVGIINQDDKDVNNQLVQIKGLNYNVFHIFRLELFGNTAVWKINNQEVHRRDIGNLRDDLFLNFIGSLHEPLNGELLPHHFEIEWVRCLQKKD